MIPTKFWDDWPSGFRQDRENIFEKIEKLNFTFLEQKTSELKMQMT